LENLRRLAGEAGVLAGIATAWIFLGFVFIFPSAGLTLIDQANPHRYLTFIAHHSTIFWTVNILGGLVASLLSVVVYLGLGDRFKEDAPASARIGSLAGVIGAAAFAAGALIRHTAYGTLSPIYATNVVGASHAFYAVSTIVGSLSGLGNVLAGLGTLVFGNVMLKERRYNNVGYFSVVAGAAMILSGFISHPFTYMISAFSAGAWLVWTALVMRGEAGPALFRWGASKARANSRSSTQRRAA